MILKDRSSDAGFWATVRKTVHPVLSDHCPFCPVCNVGALWPNGSMDQDETWLEVSLGPGHIVLDGDPVRPRKGHSSPLPQFLAHVYCGQTVGWIKMPLGTEIDLGLGHIVLDGNPAPPERGTVACPPLFGPCLAKQSPISATDELLLLTA